MRTNSTGLRLGYTTAWKNRVLVGRNYSDDYVALGVFKKYLDYFFSNKEIKKTFILGDVYLKQNNNDIISVNIQVYVPLYKRISDILYRKKWSRSLIMFKKTIIKKFLISFFKLFCIKKVSYIIKQDLIKLFPNKKVKFNYIFVKKRFFNAKLVSAYIVSSLLNKFKLTNVFKNLKKDMQFFKKRKNFIIDCSGRFDRKQRASNYELISGTVSPATFKNKISYIKNEVVLKYGICGVKVWVLK